MVLLERDAELDSIRSAVRSVAGGTGRLLVVEGQAGIGKSALLRAAGTLASAAGVRTLTARGTELERAFGFGVARQLLERAVDGEADFDGAARHAAILLDVPLTEPAPLPLGPEGAFAVLHGLYRLTATLAGRRPLAFLVDDAHWADAASLRFLAYLCNRLERLPVLLVVAARPAGEPGCAPIAEMLAEQCASGRLRLSPLTPAGSARVLRAAVPEAPAALCRACHEHTGGNPFFLREVAGALGDAGAEHAADVLGGAPDGVVASVRARLARFPESVQRFAGAAAIVGEGALIRHAAALAEIDDAAAAADALRAGRILAGTRVLAFVHPIVRTAVYEQLSPAARAAGHERAARLLAAEDASPERVAAHLLATEPHGSDWVCEQLRIAAHRAVPRGAPGASVTYLQRALEEPPSAEARPAVLLELGLAESLTLDREPAIGHLKRGVETTQDTPARLYAARTLAALVGMDDPMASVEVVERALAASSDADPRLAVQFEAHMLAMSRFALDSRRATRERAARLRARVEAGELDGPMELTVAATEMTMAGDPAEPAVALAERAVAGLRGDPIVAVVMGFAVRNLIVADRLAEAERILTATIDEARRQQANYRVGPLLAYRSDIHWRTGALAQAVTDAEAARSAYAHAGRLAVLGAAAALGQALVERGAFDAAEAALADAGPPGQAYPGTLLLNARARLWLARGDARRALADALVVGRRQVVLGEPNPAVVDWRSLAALAHAALGERDAAVALAREELALARRFGAARAIGIALRTLGLVGDDLGSLEQATTVLADSPARLEHARALTELGVALRHRRRIVEAREPLRVALDLANRCGATPLAERARTELVIAGARPRRAQLSGVAALTTNERRVAAMAAGGRSNREIAQALYVSRKTVEKHLTAAYRKLGTSAREELAAALAKE